MIRTRAPRGSTLGNLMMSIAVFSVVMGAVISGSLALHRSFSATEDYAFAKSDQMRLSDYLALDLRRAVKVTPGASAPLIMVAEIPDYYNSAGEPRIPRVVDHEVCYGDDPTVLRKITYTQSGSSIFRQENNGPQREIATGVADFQIKLEDLGKVVKSQITFAPQFSRNPTQAAREASVTFNTTLLRNKRKL